MRKLLPLLALLSASAWGQVVPLTKVYTLIPSGDSSGATDRAAFNALLSNAVQINLAPGTFYWNTGITAANQLTLNCAGASGGYSAPDTATTKIVMNTSTLTALTLQGSGSKVTNCHFSNSSTTLATAGAAIAISGAAGASVSGVTIDNVSTYGWYIGVDNFTGDTYTISNSKIYGPAQYGIRIQNTANSDLGDGVITGNWITAANVNGATHTNNTAAIFWTGGGGVKISNNKVNSSYLLASTYLFQYDIWVQPASVTATGDIFIWNNSLENSYWDAILFDGSVGNHSLGTIQIINNEFFQGGSQSAAMIHFVGSPSCKFQNITIDNVTALTAYTYAVQLDAYVEGAKIGHITSYAITTPIYLGGTGGIAQLTSTVSGVSFNVEDITQTATNPPAQILFTDYTVTANNLLYAIGSRQLGFRRVIPNLGTVPGTTTVGTFYFNAYASGRIKVTLSGNYSGYGQIETIAERAISCNYAGTCTATTVGTDYGNGGAQILLGFNVGTNNQVAVTVTTAAGQGLMTPLPGSGTIHFDVDGMVYQEVIN